MNGARSKPGSADSEPLSGSAARRAKLEWAAALVAAVLLGVYAEIGLYAPDPWGVLPEYGLPWVAIAMLWGRAVGRPSMAWLAGIIGIGVGIGTWFGFKVLVYGWFSVDYFLRHDLGYWSALAVIVGLFGGLAGSWVSAVGWRHEAGWALLVSAAIAEGGSVVLLILHRGGSHPAWRVPVAELSFGVGLYVVALARCRPRILTLWTLIGVVAGGGVGVLVLAGRV